MKSYSRTELATFIANRLQQEQHALKKKYQDTVDAVGHFYIDEVLPEEIATACSSLFPKPEEMRQLKSLKEFKHVSAQMNKHDRLLEDVLYAFQDARVVALIKDITEIEGLLPDESLYAGGLSLMKKDNFLNPHLDNSHDSAMQKWRVLNLLFYVSPDWQLPYGGHLELWPQGVKGEPILIESKFNRLVVMATHQRSWHSVNKVTVDKSRCCISNYYFSDTPLTNEDRTHVTLFKSRPEEKLRGIALEADAFLRTLVRKVFKKGIRKNPHYYKKP